jgi:hypothetical protein
MLFSGEERGILGSAYDSQNPVISYDDIVLDINVDMVGRSNGSVQGIVADQQPTWRLAYLTDGYHFERFGVPAIHFFTGLHADYHQPSDEADSIRFGEPGRILDVMYLRTRHYAEGRQRPDYRRPEWFVTPD